MKIFVLEDNPDRMSFFSSICLKHDLVMTNNVVMARNILEHQKFDYMFLDHDLGGEVYVSSSEPNTGNYMCKHMPETLNADVPVLIHSWNCDGAKNMKDTLDMNGHSGIVECVMFMTDEFNIRIREIFCIEKEKNEKT